MVRLNRIQRHAKKRHPDIPWPAFHDTLYEALESGQVKSSTKRATDTTRVPTATQILRERHRRSKVGIRRLISGGAFEMGKKP